MSLTKRLHSVMGKLVGSADKAKSTRAAALAQLRNDVAEIEMSLLKSNVKTAFRLRRKFRGRYEILAWEEYGRDGFRLTYTQLDSFEKSGGVPNYEGPLLEVDSKILLSLGPHIDTFLEKFHLYLEELASDANQMHKFKEHLNNIEQLSLFQPNSEV